MRVILVALALAACHREVRQDVKLQEESDHKTAKTADETTVETKSSAAVDVDIKTTREDNAIVVQAPDESISVLVVPRNRPLSLPKGSKVIGTVPVASTSKDESKHVGPVATEKKTEKKSDETSDETKKLAGAVKLEEVLDVGPGWKFYLTVIAALVAVLIAVYAYLKFIKKVVWL